MITYRSPSFLQWFLTLVFLLTMFQFVHPAYADPVRLTKTEAFELHDALTKLSPGLTPENTILAADAINALTPDAVSWRTGYSKLMVLQNAANQPGATPELLASFRLEDSKFTAVVEAAKVYDLPLFTITKEEIKSSVDPKTGLPAINANNLATIKRLLKPAPKDPPKT